MSTDPTLFTSEAPGLGWHVIEGEHLLELLQRVKEGEDPDMVYAELYANAEHEYVGGAEE